MPETPHASRAKFHWLAMLTVVQYWLVFGYQLGVGLNKDAISATIASCQHTKIGAEKAEN
jgi:hypothetical protein